MEAHCGLHLGPGTWFTHSLTKNIFLALSSGNTPTKDKNDEKIFNTETSTLANDGKEEICQVRCVSPNDNAFKKNR